jgi:hypothetical protein
VSPKKYLKYGLIGIAVLLIVIILNIDTSPKTNPQQTNAQNGNNIDATTKSRNDVTNLTPEQMQIVLIQQAQDDKTISDTMLSLNETTEYTIVFDYELEQFRIRLKPNANRLTSVPKALATLEDIGIENPSYYVL